MDELQEQGSSPPEKEDNNRMVRFADGGDPVTLYLRGKSTGEYEMDTKTGFRRETAREVAITPLLTAEVPSGSILRFGEGQHFLVVKPKHNHLRERFTDDIFVERINPDDPQIKREIEEGNYKILSLKEIPLSQETLNKLNEAIIE